MCEVVELPNTTTREILDVFQHPEYRNRIATFHYGGHANGFQLLLESPEGKASPAYSGGFAQFLGEQTGLQLVFLNGCSTEPPAHESSCGGQVRRLKDGKALRRSKMEI